MEEKATTIAANINGRRLVGRKAGKGGPTVVLEMGLRATGSFYDDIAEPLATFTMLKRMASEKDSVFHCMPEAS